MRLLTYTSFSQVWQTLTSQRLGRKETNMQRWLIFLNTEGCGLSAGGLGLVAALRSAALGSAALRSAA